jgi:uncharacterized membrane protein (DUF2068 family)
MSKGLKAVAAMEASKGLLSLFVGLGLHLLAKYNLPQLMTQSVQMLHLNSTNPLVHQFLAKAGGLMTGINLTLIIAGSILYGCVRLVEAYGLWHEMVWTEWFALISCGVYVPFEIYEIIQGFDFFDLITLLINLLIVGYMIWILRQPRKTQ